MERRDPAEIGDERSQLQQFLDFQRATILMKVDGLERRQMAMTTAALVALYREACARSRTAVDGHTDE